MPQVCIRIFWAYLTNRFVTEKNGKKRKKKLETLFKGWLSGGNRCRRRCEISLSPGKIFENVDEEPDAGA